MPYSVLTPIRLTVMPGTVLGDDIVAEHELGDSLVEPIDGDGDEPDHGHEALAAALDERANALDRDAEELARRATELEELQTALHRRSDELDVRAREVDDRDRLNGIQAASLSDRETAVAAREAAAVAKPRRGQAAAQG